MPSRKSSKIKLLELQNLYLGVDGGGTKTGIVLINEKKQIVGEGIDGASNPLRVGIETAVANIFKAVDSACDIAGLNRGDIVAATLGLAGVRREDLRKRVYERFIRDLHIKPVEVCTDAEIALYGATLGKAGLVAIAGTGSVCIGQNDKGQKASAGGWGPIAGDEGGGAGIARRALQAIAKAFDGRGKATSLSELALDYFRAGQMDDLSVAIYAPQIDNAKIAGFARIVIEAAQGCDDVAKEVLRDAAFELALAANAVIKKLNMEHQKFPVAKVGSIFSAGELFTVPFLQKIQTVAPKAFLTEPILSPAVAAAQWAFENYHQK